MWTLASGCRNHSIAALILTCSVLSCAPKRALLKEQSWQRSNTAATVSRNLDTVIEAAPLVPVYVRMGGVAGLRFIGARTVNVEKFGDSLCLTATVPDTASLLFVRRGSGDTVLRIRIMARSNPAYAAAKRLIDYNNESYIRSDSLAVKLWRFQLLNKPFPALALRKIEGGTLPLPDSLKGRAALVNRWYFNCPPCMEEIPELNHLTRLYGNRAHFVAVFKDSAYFRNGQPYFYQEHYTISNGGPIVKNASYEPLDFRFRHFYAAGRGIDALPGIGYPTTYLLDAEGIIRLNVTGAGEGMGRYWDEQIMLYEHASGFTD